MTKTDNQAVEHTDVYVSSHVSKKLPKSDRLAVVILALIDVLQDELSTNAAACNVLRAQVQEVLDGR